VKQAQVIWSESALASFKTVLELIDQKSPTAATRISEQIIARAIQLETFPESGAVQQTKSNFRQYRYLVEGHYKIIYSYRIEERVVYIEKIFDTRSDPSKLKM
jgi:plasmid stabilization system protein ParE